MDPQHEIWRPDVLVVGAGVGGSLLAKRLHDQGYEVVLAEKQTGPQEAFKGEYLQPAAVDIFFEFGFGSVLESAPSATPIRELRFRDLDNERRIKGDLLMRYRQGRFAYSISHYELIEGMRNVVRDALGDCFFEGVRLEPARPIDGGFYDKPAFVAKACERKTQRIEPRYALGCDGRASSVRRWMGGKPAPRNGTVAPFCPKEVIVGARDPQPASQPSRYEVVRLRGKGTLSAFSLGNHGQRLYFSAADDVPSPKKRAWFSQLEGVRAQARCCVKLEPLDGPRQIMVSPAYSTWLGPATKRSFLLVGDSACVTTPFSGQGMTQVAEHCRFLTQSYDFSAAAAQRRKSQNRRYEAQVRATFRRLQVVNSNLYNLFFARSPLYQDLAEAVLARWNQSPDLKQHVMDLFAGDKKTTPTLREITELFGLNPWLVGGQPAQGLGVALSRRTAQGMKDGFTRLLALS